MVRVIGFEIELWVIEYGFGTLEGYYDGFCFGISERQWRRSGATFIFFREVQALAFFVRNMRDGRVVLFMLDTFLALAIRLDGWLARGLHVNIQGNIMCL